MSDQMNEEESKKPGHECGGCGVWVYPEDYCSECGHDPSEPVTYETIWQKLSNVDVKDQTAQRGKFTYLSWSWAWGVLMDHYPQAEYKFATPIIYADTSVEVRCIVTIDDCHREMWLPVMNHKNEAVKNPDARKISDSKMRCMVKCIAMFGLGHYIYAGEDVPVTATLTKAKAKGLYSELSKDMVDDVDSLEALKDWGERKASDINTLPEDWQDMIREEFKTARQFWIDRENDELFPGDKDGHLGD